MTTNEALAVVRERMNYAEACGFGGFTEALAALTFIEQRLGEAEEAEVFRNACLDIGFVPAIRAEKAEAERDEYAQQWAEVEEALHNYWFSQKPMTAGDAVRKLLAERDELKQRATENWDSYENANRRIEELERERDAWMRMADGHRMAELEAALREIESATVPKNERNVMWAIARRALGSETAWSKPGKWAERCPACKGYKDQEHRYDLTCDEKVE